jgi:hypothetical protein
MKKMKQLNLPRIYQSTSEKFKKHDGRAKLSYSQYTSWKDPQYKNSYILGYMFGIRQAGNNWSLMGSQVGTAIEYRMDFSKAEGADKELLDSAMEHFNETDIATLHKVNKMFPENAEYEREIVLDRGHYVTQGFIDMYISDNQGSGVSVIDVKTGGKNSKSAGAKNPAFYASDGYGQTNLYMRALEEEGETPGYCGVVFIDRTFAGTFEEPILHLSGDIIEVETPYTKERVNKLLESMDKTAMEISSLKDTYDKLSTLTIEL